MDKLEQIAIDHPDDPVKLRKIKKHLREHKENYFTCVIHPNVPPDNNKAERALRHLVLKRKMSHGSKTHKGADVMSVLYSVMLSLWWKSKKSFLKEYAQLINSV